MGHWRAKKKQKGNKSGHAFTTSRESCIICINSGTSSAMKYATTVAACLGGFDSDSNVSTPTAVP